MTKWYVKFVTLNQLLRKKLRETFDFHFFGGFEKKCRPKLKKCVTGSQEEVVTPCVLESKRGVQMNTHRRDCR